MTAVTQTEFARQLGVAKSWITKLKQDGRLVMTPDGLVDVEATRKRLAATSGGERDDVAARWAAQRGRALPAEAPPEDDEPAADGIPSKAVSAAKKEHYAALQAEVDYRRSVGELVERADVEQAVGDVVTVVRQALENLPHRTGPELVGKDLDQIRAILKADLHAALAEMEREFGKRIEALAQEGAEA